MGFMHAFLALAILCLGHMKSLRQSTGPVREPMGNHTAYIARTLLCWPKVEHVQLSDMGYERFRAHTRPVSSLPGPNGSNVT